jgi:hypothetical protein
MEFIYGSYIYDDEIEDIMESINKDTPDYFYADDYFNGAIEANEYINLFFPNNIVRFYPKSEIIFDPDEPLWIIGFKTNSYYDLSDITEEEKDYILEKELMDKIYNDYKEICDFFLIKKSKKLYYFSVKN